MLDRAGRPGLDRRIHAGNPPLKGPPPGTADTIKTCARRRPHSPMHDGAASQY
ncbi:hypothetical protein C882_3744 [Caenispirillum salinarum AK4]|uniref:Uncharacterized protein n=1 Tax=Caenispirillum salinarum AK4 TaxID=1238182 RepID=K9HSR9_9PROT|nr:hypothetical protein C882_3744 [Caenispirillum salinarum AK4]